MTKRQVVDGLNEVGFPARLKDVAFRRLWDDHFIAVVSLNSPEERRVAQFLPRPQGISTYGIDSHNLYLLV
jgi:hypothetical protein